jgi:hypothetical protein
MNNIIKKLVVAARKPLLLLETKFDKYYLLNDVPTPKIVNHENWEKYLVEIGNKPGIKILEIGSREVTGESRVRKHLQNAEYTGLRLLSRQKCRYCW